MIDPEPGEAPDDAEPTQLVLAEPTIVDVTDSEIDESDVIITVQVDELDDYDDDLVWSPGYVLLAGQSLAAMQYNLGLVGRKIDHEFDKYLQQTEWLLVEGLRRELPEPYQFDQ